MRSRNTAASMASAVDKTGSRPGHRGSDIHGDHLKNLLQNRTRNSRSASATAWKRCFGKIFSNQPTNLSGLKSRFISSFTSRRTAVSAGTKSSICQFRGVVRASGFRKWRKDFRKINDPSFPVQPIIWSSSKIRNSNDMYRIRFHLINNAKRKSVHKATTGIFRHGRPCIRKSNNEGYCGIDFLCKFQTETTLAIFIEVNSFVEFGFRILMKIELHLLCFSRILAKTSSPEIH